MTSNDNQLPALPDDAAPATEPPAAVAAASEAIWFHEEDGSRKGPLTEAEMVVLIGSGKVTGSTAVWKKGFPDWLKLERTELKAYLDDKAPPPLRGEHINNTVIWVLAFAPLIGLMLEYFVAGIIYRNGRLAELAVENNKYWFITVALNIGLCYYDEHRLKLAGHDTSKFKGLAFIVPVYLYQRAMALHHNLAYFIVWIACFLFIMVA
ncbi:MAG: DUF4339 domain-containing protein [Polaromonas sp.]|uniref:DUF4339 domain-containing protein n=1 Tax=Polaromonas sp. TaxID=1869339 RepID=UPI002487C510|nr:DUF4339 domain-containing protein [Polaromonas sp.]MDI1270530.1 DUF4339 domain-containing protein [Polaromonas sp.]